MSFYEYLMKQCTRQDPVGDLARDAKDDLTLRKAMSFTEWEDYLESKNACDGAMTAFKLAWDEYAESPRMYVEFSVEQDCFHIDTMERIQKSNLGLCSKGTSTGYVIIAGPVTSLEAFEICEKYSFLKQEVVV